MLNWSEKTFHELSKQPKVMLGEQERAIPCGTAMMGLLTETELSPNFYSKTADANN